MRMILGVVLVFASGLANAAEPRAKITGPMTTVCGQCAIFKATDSTGVRKFRWKVTPRPDSLDSLTVTKDGEIVVDPKLAGQFLLIGSGKPAVYTIELMVTGLEGDWDEASVEHEFMPRANTTPVTPLPRLDLSGGEPAATAVESAPQDTLLASTSWARKVRSESPKREAKQIADSLRSCAALVSSTNISTPEELVKATATMASKSVGEPAWGDWSDSWFADFHEHLDGLSDQGVLETMNDYEETWISAAKGLERFAGR